MDRKVLHSIIDHNTGQFGENIAIQEPQRSMSYTGLRTLSNQIGNALAGNGSKKGSVTALYMDSCIEYVASILGINKSGGIFMPLECSHPDKRLVTILEQVRPQYILTTPGQLPKLRSLLNDGAKEKPRYIFVIDSDVEGTTRLDVAHGYEEVATTFSDDAPESIVAGDDSNYLLFTSGSTGKPKAIEGCHKSLSHFIHWEVSQFGLDAEVRVSQMAPVSFDVSLRDIFVPLLAGGTLFIPDLELKSQPLQLVKWFAESGVSLIHTVPSLFRVIIRTLQENNELISTLDKLKYILLAGEALYGKDVLEWRNVMGDKVALVNVYGPSETTLAKAFYRIEGADVDPKSIIPLGHPIDNAMILIINDGQLCKPGQVGEIHIKTPFMSKGYYGDEALTKEKFIQNPLHNDAKDIVYATGDLGKYLPDRTVVFAGRKDSQVKVMGNRVELSEIEQALKGLDLIELSVVQAVHKEEQVELACYFTEKEKVDEEAIRNYLKQELPSYMIPNYFVRLSEFPLNTNGKIDRKALPKVEIAVDGVYQAPSNEVERKIEEIWKEMLNISRVGRNVSFFSLGGSSLKALQIISRIFKEFNVLLKLTDFFVKPTIRELADIITQSRETKYEKFPKIAEAQSYDLSDAQRRLWVLSHFEEENKAYNIQRAYKLQGQVNEEALNHALKQVVSRHESLRTVFIAEDDIPKQKIVSVDELRQPVDFQDWSDKANADQLARNFVKERALKPFDLENGPLYRADLIKTAKDSYVFLFTIHHIIADGWSMEVLINEVLIAYEAFLEGSAPQLDSLRIQYKDYAAWINKRLSGSDDIHGDYWKKQFEGELPQLDLLPGRSRPAFKTYNGKRHSFTVDTDSWRNIGELAKKENVTLYTILLSAYNLLLYKYTGQYDFIVGTPIAGRDDVELENQIGLYINTLALRTKIDPERSFLELVHQVQGNVKNAFEHKSYPFDRLVNQLPLSRDPGRSPLFDTMLVLHSTNLAQTDTLPSLREVEVSDMEIEASTSKYDLMWEFSESQAGLSVSLEYNLDLFDEEFIIALSSHLQNIIKAALHFPEKNLKDLRYISKEEEGVILNFDNTEHSFPDQTIPELFEAQVIKTPHAPAVVYNNTRLSYQELHHASDQLAHYLKETFQLQPGDIVGIRSERSEKLIAALLAVLKTGAAFVPIDPEYPTSRVQYITEDAGIGMIIGDAGPGDLPQHVEYLNIGEYWGEIMKGYTTEGKEVFQTGSLAYVMYTSGSTGKPKGVEVTHANLANYLLWANSYYFEGDSGFPFALFTSISFDLTLTSIFTPLLRGDYVEVIGKMPSLQALQQVFNHEHIRAVKMTPSHVRLLDDLGINSSSISRVIIGGEQLLLNEVGKLERLNPSVKIYNEYGPTEATIGCTVKQVSSSQLVISIGKPISNTKVYVVDENLNLQAPGVAGELCVSGRGIASGYHNKPALTAEKFVDNPFEPGKKLYRTGDLAIRQTNGELLLLGRMDNQVKINGYRIEINEVREVMMTHQGIKTVALNVIKDSNSHLLVAYFVANEVPAPDELRNYLYQYLPAYMVPAFFVPVDHIPLTINGKVDFDALPDPKGTDRLVSNDIQKPENDTESSILEIWKSVLDIEDIGVADNFYEVGGDSMKLVKLYKALQKNFSGQMSMADLFKYNTVKAQSEYLMTSNVPVDDIEGIEV